MERALSAREGARLGAPGVGRVKHPRSASKGGTLATPTRPLHRALHFSARITALDRLAAIILFLAFGQRDLDLGFSLRTEVNAEGHDRESLLLRLAQELADFFAME